MTKRWCVVLFAFVLSPAVGYAQQGAPPQFFPADQVVASVLPDSGAAEAPLTVDVLSDQGSYQYLVVRRSASGVAEVHDAWSDVTVVREGSGTLTYGGYVSGGEEEEPGEWRGGSIQSGQTESLSPGDAVVIPAGTPHQITLESDETIVYTVVKIRSPGTEEEEE